MKMLAVGNASKSGYILELHMSPFGGQQPLILETGKYATHCFFGYAKVITDIATRHAQVKSGGGITAPLEASG